MEHKYFIYRVINILFALGVIMTIAFAFYIFFQQYPHASSRADIVNGEVTVVTYTAGTSLIDALFKSLLFMLLIVPSIYLIREALLYIFYAKKFFKKFEIRNVKST